MKARHLVTVEDRRAPIPGQLDFTATPAVDRSIEARFRSFHDSNPHVYDLLVKLAREHRDRAGFVLGIKALWEVARYSLTVESGEPYRLNNSFTALYAREIMANEPDLADAFRTRERVA